MTKLDQSILERIEAAISLDKEKPGLGNVDIHKAQELLTEVGAVFLDVRPPSKVTGENAQEANVPNAFYTPFTEFTEYLDVLPKDKTTPIVTACLKGWFANRIAGYLEVLGYENVYVLDTDIEDFIEIYKAAK
ncbi:rhodanese-like domain-containing protein [Nitrosophilus alvini]|uniref:rhodanese-like domain-containing protein n=1 Tax=Nitrosophilus alvini TaxID=2714855 RepID=UPI001909FD42|nr:rhodanese-like domain-containing protein [Nitrosophilus alvini]